MKRDEATGFDDQALVSPADNTQNSNRNAVTCARIEMFNALINSLSKIGAELNVVSSFYTLPLTTSLAGSDASASCVVKSLAVTWHCHRPSSNSRVADLTHKEQSPMSGLPTHSYFFKCIPIGWNDSSRGQLAVVITGIRLSNGNIMSGGWNIGGNSTTFRKSFVNGGGGIIIEGEARFGKAKRGQSVNRGQREVIPTDSIDNGSQGVCQRFAAIV